MEFIYKVFVIRQTIGKYLLSKGYSDNNIYYLIKNKNVIINDTIVRDKNDIVSFNDKVLVKLLEEKNDLVLWNQHIDIVYEDKYLLIVNKPYNMDVEPTRENNKHSLANAISFYFNENSIKSKVHLVNRLDKLTQGLVIVAKNQYIHNLFKNVNIKKHYLALVCGHTCKRKIIKVNIGMSDKKVKRQVRNDGKKSITKFKLVEYVGNNSLIDIRLLTGRTHQIRLSLAHIGHALLSDPLYGNKDNENKMYLKAYKVSFNHPITSKKIDISIE